MFCAYNLTSPNKKISRKFALFLYRLATGGFSKKLECNSEMKKKDRYLIQSIECSNLENDMKMISLMFFTYFLRSFNKFSISGHLI